MLSNTHSDHKRWLKVTAVVVGCFAPVFLLASMETTSVIASFSLQALSWRKHSFVDPTARFISALCAGFLLGWAVTIWLISSSLYDLAPEQTRRAVLAGAIAWFVLDCLGSILSGNPANAISNIPTLLLAVGPLWRPAVADS